MLQSLLSGDKGPLMTFCSFIFGSIFVNIQVSLSIVSFAIAIIVGVLTIVEKVTALKNKKNK